MIAGLVGGFAGAWAMSRFQSLIAKPNADEAQKSDEQQAEDSTVKTAERIARAVSGQGLSKEQKKIAGPVVHYLYGAGIGAVYGGAASRFKPAAAGFGTAYGAAAWALGDEVAVPALGLGTRPSETPLSKHLQEFGAHLVYGAALEGVRRLGLKAMGE